MIYEEIEPGLKKRGFVGIEGMDSMGECHKDNKHFILRTDGLIIYSNIPFWTDTEYHPGSVYKIWDAVADKFTKGKAFNWEELDEFLYANRNHRSSDGEVGSV